MLMSFKEIIILEVSANHDPTLLLSLLSLLLYTLLEFFASVLADGFSLKIE